MAALLAAGCTAGGGEDPPAAAGLAGAAGGRDVVLLSVGGLRADRLGVYGYEGRDTSPRLDALVAGGVVFERAQTARPESAAALATALSGRYPAGAAGLTAGLADDDLLAGRFAAAGYRTAAFVAAGCEVPEGGWQELACGGSDGATVAAALEWAGRDAGPVPRLLWVHLGGAGYPFSGGSDLAALMDPGYPGPLAPSREPIERVLRQRLALTPRDIIHLDALYDGAVMAADRHAGELLDGLALAGLDPERAVVALFSDHGEELYEHHGMIGHRCSPYQTALQIPLAVVANGLLPAARVPQPVELADLAPTLLELAGLPPLAAADGLSLTPYLERPGEGGRGKPAYSTLAGGRIEVVVAGGWKLIDNPEGVEPACVPGAAAARLPLERRELYYLESDPAELDNLAERRPAMAARLGDLLRRHLPR